jgi:hypothetical protein
MPQGDLKLGLADVVVGEDGIAQVRGGGDIDRSAHRGDVEVGQYPGEGAVRQGLLVYRKS